jgi:glycosyltransferase involved in cell wall biosynthesis
MNESKNLKILFLPGWYPTEKNQIYGIFVREHAKAVSLYNEVIVLYNEGSERKNDKLWKVFSDKKEEGIRTIRIRHKEISIFKINYFIHLSSIIVSFRNLIKMGWRPDIIHVHILSAVLPGVILGIIYKIPVVITEHWSGFPRRSMRFSEKMIAKFVMNKARLILPVSKDLGNKIKSYGIKSKIEIIPNVVNTALFHPQFNKSNSSKNNNEIIRILLVASLTPIKGIPYLFKALAKLKEKRQDFILNIVGDGPFRQEYERLADGLALTNIVKFQGLKTKVELAEIMRNCDFFVLPSLWETFGCVLIEAMASGLPLIASDVGGVGEIINESIGILVTPKDINSLATNINYMLDHYQNYSSAALFETAKNNYSYETVGKNLNKIYRQISPPIFKVAWAEIVKRGNQFKCLVF